MLDMILNQMIYEARHSTSHVSYRKLKNALRIHIQSEKNTIVLTLGRDKVYPSETEWNTVLRSWPFKINPDPVPTIHHGRLALQAHIQMTTEMQTTMKLE
jgi:hypothetical protein